MRTTITLPDSLFRRVKAMAALEGKTLRAFVTEAVAHEIDRSVEKQAAGHRVKGPLVRSRKPGSLRMTSQTVSEALVLEDMNAVT
jgi:hypothetical protein